MIAPRRDRHQTKQKNVTGLAIESSQSTNSASLESAARAHTRRSRTGYLFFTDGPAAELGVDALIDVDGQFARHYAASALY
jgi:hypothetical protein